MTAWTDFNRVRDANPADWINRADATINLGVQFPPSTAYMSGDHAGIDNNGPGVPRYLIPNGKSAGDYAKYNMRGPAATSTRFVDLLKLVNGRNLLGLGGQYVTERNNIGNHPNGGTQWDDAVINGMRRLMVYADERGLPIVPVISPLTIQDPNNPFPQWGNGDVVNRNSVVVHEKLDGAGNLTGVDHEWRSLGFADRTTGSQWDLTEQAQWIDLGPVGRGLREEILRPIVHEMRYRYGSEWMVFNWSPTNPAVEEFKSFLGGELAKPIISNLADLSLPEYGGKGYPDPDDQTSIFPAGALD